MRVLGVDPGLTRCGIGIVKSLPARKVELVHVTVARSNPEEDMGQRLLQINDAVEQALSEFQPDAVAIERVFAQHNVSTVMGTAQVAGLVMVAATRRNIPVALHTPSEVKAAVTGNGKASKDQVQRMVARILNLAELPKPADAADALALGICHLWRPVDYRHSGGNSGTGMKVPTGGRTAAQEVWAQAEARARRGARDT